MQSPLPPVLVILPLGQNIAMQWNERKIRNFSYEGLLCMLCTCETRPLRPKKL